MSQFYVNTQAQDNGDHEVHTTGCSHPPLISNRKELGYFSNCHEAVAVARISYPTANGCYWCCRECHTS
jgi:hypothetical protein